eukprot:5127716-Prymnesium_polylepis.1
MGHRPSCVPVEAPQSARSARYRLTAHHRPPVVSLFTQVIKLACAGKFEVAQHSVAPTFLFATATQLSKTQLAAGGATLWVAHQP